MKSSFLWPVYSAKVKNVPYICIVEGALNRRKKDSETIISFQGMETGSPAPGQTKQGYSSGGCCLLGL